MFKVSVICQIVTDPGKDNIRLVLILKFILLSHDAFLLIVKYILLYLLELLEMAKGFYLRLNVFESRAFSLEDDWNQLLCWDYFLL